MMEAFGLSRSRDSKCKVVNRSLKPWVNCIHTLVGGGYCETMGVLIVDVYE